MKRWKVIVADDEAIIREGIIGSIPWATMQLEVVAEAEDGEEALEAALEHKADIMLVDLSMPIMNGLTLIRKLQSELPNCKVMIITGHDEFAYAQEAIKLEVHDYILKPVNPQLLMNVLQNIVSKLEENHIQQQLIEQAAKQIDKNINLLRERFCQDWVSGQLTEHETMEQLQFLQMTVTPPLVVGIIRLQNVMRERRIAGERDRQLLLYAIENIATECLEEQLLTLFRDEKQDIILMLQQYPESAVNEYMLESISRYLKVEIMLNYAYNTQSFIGVHQAYMEIKEKMNREAKLSPLIKQAKEWIESNYANQNVSLDQLAGYLHVTSVYISRLFKQELGYSFVHYLTYVRMKHAVQLLQDRSLSIHEISEQIGYDTQHYFSTAFKRMIGMSPNQYRKKGL